MINDNHHRIPYKKIEKLKLLDFVLFNEKGCGAAFIVVPFG